MTTRHVMVFLIFARLAACCARGSDTEIDTSAARDCGANETKTVVYLIAGSWIDEPDDGTSVEVESVGIHLTEPQY